MATVTVTFNVNFNDASVGAKGVLLSVNEFKDQFLWGLPLFSPATQQTIPDNTIKQKIAAAQSMIERMLDLRLLKQYLTETKDFVSTEYSNWGYVSASYNINRIITLTAQLNQQPVFAYPFAWLTINTSQVDQFRNINLVPNGSGTVNILDLIASTNNQWFNLLANQRIPNFFLLEYIAGFTNVPPEIINLIGKKAAVEILPVLELIITGGGNNTGFSFGASSTSLSLDGLSQSISKANGGNIFQQRLKQYTDEIRIETQQLKDIYSGLKFDVA